MFWGICRHKGKQDEYPPTLYVISFYNFFLLKLIKTATIVMGCSNTINLYLIQCHMSHYQV